LNGSATLVIQSRRDEIKGQPGARVQREPTRGPQFPQQTVKAP
jgi:hypothetical protein